MIKAPSLVATSTLLYSGDPAMSLPEEPAERERVLELARETGRWSDLYAEGKTPIAFDVRTMTGTAYEWLCGESARRALTLPEVAALALRLSLRNVTGLGDIKIKRNLSVDFWMTNTEPLDAIYASPSLGRAAVMELGTILYIRAQESPSPK